MVLVSKALRRFKKLPREIKDYLRELDQKCQKYGVKLILSGGKSVNFGSGRCGGYFNDSDKILKVAIGGNEESILSVALHEESHMEDQWKNPLSIWHDYKTYNGYNRFFHHVNGGRIYKRKQAIQAAIKLEKECEQFTIKKIKAKWLDFVDLDKYIANSNCYLFSYLYMAETRKWPSKTPCDRKFRAHCHTKLLRSYRQIPENLRAAFDKWL